MRKVEFIGSQGYKLAAVLDEPIGEIRAYALFAHCFACSKNEHAVYQISKALANKGIAVLRFDFTGLGDSKGQFADTNFSSNIQDLIKAAEYMHANLKAPAILVGHSLGGAAVLSAAKHISVVKAVVTIGAPAEASHVMRLFKNKTDEVISKGEAEVSLGSTSFKVKKQFLEDIESQSLEGCIKNLKKALLIMHSPLDKIVGIDNAAKIFSAAKHPKSFVTLDNADHMITNKKDASYAADVIAAWAERYVPSLSGVTEIEDLKQGCTLVSSTNRSKFQQKVQVGKHVLLADEPTSYGGDDTGPGPYDFLNIALGACKSMTLKMYAEHKNLPLEAVHVCVSHDKVHAKDCADCEDESKKIDQFDCEITVQGKDLTEADKEKLLHIADKCPVHKTLANKSIIKTSRAQT